MSADQLGSSRGIVWQAARNGAIWVIDAAGSVLFSTPVLTKELGEVAASKLRLSGHTNVCTIGAGFGNTI